MSTKVTKCPQKLPNGRKIDEMDVKYTDIFHCMRFKIYPKWDFWFPIMPSGKPGSKCHEMRKLVRIFFQDKNKNFFDSNLLIKTSIWSPEHEKSNVH
jgi:hypothetical protein